jgi:hypothetical protein
MAPPHSAAGAMSLPGPRENCRDVRRDRRFQGTSGLIVLTVSFVESDPTRTPANQPV